jgi:predicted transcriptional regulator YdeE
VFSHRGTSHDRRRTYDLLYARWLPERGLEPAEQPPFEEYAAYSGGLEGIDQVTHVHVPLARGRAA